MSKFFEFELETVFDLAGSKRIIFFGIMLETAFVLTGSIAEPVFTCGKEISSCRHQLVLVESMDLI